MFICSRRAAACSDNPDLGRDQVLCRCASDAKFASGATLVDALFGFGLYMGQDDIRAAYLKALVGEITDVSASSRAAAWLGLLLRTNDGHSLRLAVPWSTSWIACLPRLERA